MGTQQRKPRSRRPAPHLQSFDAILINAGMKPGPFISALKKDLTRTADPVRAVNNLHRFLTSGFPTTVLRDFHQHRVLQQIALELFSQSQYLADVLVRDPGLFRWLTTTPALKIAKSNTELLQEALSAANLFSRLDRKLDSLKRFHRREILRIGAREILREADVATVTRELSDLADAVIEAVLQIGRQELAVRTGATFSSTFVVVGLGKLGGQELNFSSDIDLLFLYERDAEFEAPQERIRTFHEYYNRLAEFVVKKLTEFSGEGHLYRVDMRLRPEGTSGSLALSVPGSLQYYEIRGETWERQMLVKSRPLAGNLETGRAWIEAVRPFVYPRTFLRNPLEEIVEMKERIEQRTDSRSNLKLGEGGIRDIEFIVQGLQLLNGGIYGRLRETNTLKALELLADEEKLLKKDARLLGEAYKFLRTVEHRLQLLHGAQTHSLPLQKTEAEVLARRLSFPGERAFSRTVEKYRRSVRSVFNRIFLKPAETEKHRRGRRKPAVRIKSGEGAERNLGRLMQAIPSLEDAAESDRFVQAVEETHAAEWALESLAILADSLPIRRALRQAWKNDEMMKLLALLGARSRATLELLAKEPLLFETFIGQPEEIFKPEWGWQFLKAHDPQKFKSYNEHKSLIPFLAGQEDYASTVERLSALAEETLIEACSELPHAQNFCLLAVGKVGGREISFGSDLDLVLLYDKEALDPVLAEQAAIRLRENVTGRGLYEVDYQLRPEGKNAPLAVEMRYYEEYLRTRASLWERQSLVKASILTGSPNLRKAAGSIIEKFVYEAPLPADWITGIMRMRERIENERSGPDRANLKTGPGGLMDLEFGIQILQLRFGRQRTGLRDQNSFAAVQHLRDSGIGEDGDFRSVVNNLKFLRMLETFVRLNGVSGEFILPTDPACLNAIAAAVGKTSGADLKQSLSDLLGQNRGLLLKFSILCSS